MADGNEDPIREARARAANSLKPLTAEQWRAAGATCFGATLLVAGTLAAMVGAGMIGPQLAWRLLGTAAPLTAFVALGTVYYSRLAERSDALRDLLAAQRQYEILLQTAWDERDQAQNAARIQAIEVDTVRRLLVGGAIMMRRPEDDR